MKKLFKWLPFSLSVLLVSGNAAQAHHSFSMFNRQVEMVKTGTVARWAFNNPHSWLYLNVTNDDGTETLWSFEAAAPPQLVARGIVGSTFEPGDTLTVLYCPLVDGRPGGGMGWVRLEDGTFINPSDGGCNGDETNISRWKGWLEQGITSSAEVD